MIKRCMAGLLGAAVAVSFSFAQVSPEISTGSKAVLFTFQGLDGLSADSYNGGIGGKYYLMEQIALRGSLAFAGASEDNATGYGSNSAMLFGLSVGAEYHLSFARVSPFIGGEVGFSTTSTTIEDSVTGVNPGERTRKNFPIASMSSFTPGPTLGLGGVGGVEFFITNEVSLSAEYLLGCGLPLGYKQVTTTKRAATATTPAATETDEQEMPGRLDYGIFNSGRLTLAVYF